MAAGHMSCVVETDRLLLRQATPGDVDDLLGIFSDPIAMQYYSRTKTREETAAWLRWNMDDYARHGFGLWVVTLKGTREFVGQCGLVMQADIDGKDEVEIGYLMLRRHWNEGFATEAACACRDYGLGQLRLARLVSLINPQNAPSRRVAEKVGMSLEKEINLKGRPTCVYATDGSGVVALH